MTLQNILNIISGDTPIKIIVDFKVIFAGCMSDTTKTNFNIIVGPYLSREVYRLNTMDGFITIAC